MNGVVYFGTADGKIHRFADALNDNGTAISAIWKSGFTDCGAYQFKKNSRDMWFMIEPKTRTSVKIKAPTNRKNEDDPTLKIFEEQFKFFDFNDVLFDDFSFETNRNPKTFHIKLKAKKYTVIQIIIENAEDNEELVFLSYKINVEVGNSI